MRRNSIVRPKGEIRQLKRLRVYLAPYKLRIALAVLAILFTSSSILGMGQALRFLVDEGLSEGDVGLLNEAYVMLLGVTALLALASYARFFLVSWLGERVVADIRSDVFKRLVRMDVTFFETTRTGELLSRLTADTTLLQSVIGSSVSVAFRNILTLSGGLALLMITSAELTGYVLGMMPLVIAPILIIGRKVRGYSRDAQARVAELNAHAEEAISGIRTVQALTLEDAQVSRFGQEVDAALGTAFRRIRTRATLTALVIALIFGAVVTVLWIGGHDVMNGRISAGDLSAFVFYSVIVAGAVGALSEVATDLQRAAGAAERLGELLLLEPAVASPDKPNALPAGGLSVAFDAVHFHYPSRRDKSALTQFSLNIEPGERVALVGPSGAGKSTVFQLLLRFYDPITGAIRIGGQDVRELSIDELRRAIALVPQEPVIFSADAFANIRAGRPEATDEEVREAARLAHVLEFLDSLPQGLSTHLGEKGVQLSGGQKQRIAIARAIIRQPRILLLDEATSALDAENEHLVQQALSGLMQGRTTLAIAHRLSTVMNADRIVLINGGVIEAVGKHRELIEKSPLYSRLAALQFNRDLEA